jgi:protein-S-isoprenylcysteine O-methyltransferase Ste14
MTELLRGLGVSKVTLLTQAWLVALIGLATALFLVAAPEALPVWGTPTLLVHAGLWVIWLGWLGLLFPRSRQVWLRRFGSNAFKPAFYLEILPGIGCSFAQIGRPAVEGLIRGPEVCAAGLAIGLVLVAGGLALIALAVHRLGIAGTLFVREYERLPPALECHGIFRGIRHPLFVGAAVLAFGSAVIVGGTMPAALALINLLVIPAYVRLEDLRCGQIFGDSYDHYRASVGGVVPRRHSLEQKMPP